MIKTTFIKFQKESFANAFKVGIRIEKIYKKENPPQVFSSKYCKIFKNTYFEEHLRTAASALIVNYCPLPNVYS